MTSVFHQLLQTESFVDVTLACNDLSLKAHKVVLSACSSYFQKLLLENPCKHPTIIMPQDVCFSDLKFIIEFVYKGEIDVSQAELQSLLKTADQLKIKGLCEVSEDKENTQQGRESPVLTQRTLPKFRRLLNKRPRSSENSRRPLKKEYTDRADSIGIDDQTDENNDMPVVVEERKPRSLKQNGQTSNMTGHGLLPAQLCVDNEEFPPEPPGPAATPVRHVEMHECSPPRTLLTNTESSQRGQLIETNMDNEPAVKIKLETLRSLDQSDTIDIDSHMSSHSMGSHSEEEQGMHTMMITPELMGLIPTSSSHSDISNEGNTPKSNGHSESHRHSGGPKTWTQEDMELALDALRNHNMSLTKASATYGIPSTTLWQRAHRLGIDTPKKEGPTKSWTEDSLNSALEALRTGTISANKASKAYGIPSSTLYKIARREGIRLAAPFNAAPTTWSQEDLERALEAIRSGQTSVQRASTEFGIPTGTLYGRCKREGIELSRSNPTPWSEDAMGEALEAVRVGQMSINQAAIHYNLPYSSLYGRFKRGKYDTDHGDNSDGQSDQVIVQYHSQHHHANVSPYQHQNS
ncbi:pipsqueak [Carabus blaptoides fortunei]